MMDGYTQDWFHKLERQIHEQQEEINELKKILSRSGRGNDSKKKDECNICGSTWHRHHNL